MVATDGNLCPTNAISWPWKTIETLRITSGAATRLAPHPRSVRGMQRFWISQGGPRHPSTWQTTGLMSFNGSRDSLVIGANRAVGGVAVSDAARWTHGPPVGVDMTSSPTRAIIRRRRLPDGLLQVAYFDRSSTCAR